MSKVKITKGKFQGIQACAGSDGVIAAAAMDQRGSLMKSIGKAMGREATPADLTEFKVSVSKVLTPHATALLMDPEYGLPAVKARAPGTGVLLAYEKTGYDVSKAGRLPDLLDEWSVYRLAEAGADAIKILLYYNPFDTPKINTIKHAFLERIGAECRAIDKPFFLEPLAYDDKYDEKGLEFARLKPKYVAAYMEEFSKDRYGVDILKVEVPVNMKYVSGTSAFAGGDAAQTRDEAKKLFKDVSKAATKPFIYLSAGVTDEIFRETIALAGEAGADFCGVLCGRATWQEGIPAYGKGGRAALEEWLSGRGVQNIEALNTILHQHAKPWYHVYGGLENIDVI
ncbi:MAG: tagatose 1,6-diphosphate aldolase [Bacteroidota bacterium]|nr:tagatose 1,6-diphosphate aldolase [Bacteroidota bacterium]MDP4233099.1 tagatose 1,6-diphosphate aldolase [Bacteroidota bacterium]MDP4241756.1 tagatose 1,6-diphosphate aldolase [Bacteroidota bacterium]MDP4287414.1 tagatose 1,6-diphosphate aldolase [Bacteroidota bacterium]